jgi:tyrosine-specific transport protein
MMKIIYGISILAGTIIGAGLFSLPYITSVVGLGVMTGYMLLIGSIAILVHYFLGEISLKTPDFLRLPGFAKHHLGKNAQKIAYISGIIGMIGAILAYLILGGEFLTALLSPYLGGGTLHYTTLYFIIASLFIFFGIKAISKIEFWGIVIFIILLFVTFFRGIGEITTEKLLFMREGEFDLFLPYGALLFALWGAALVPEIEEMLGSGKEKKKLLKIIPLGVIISLFISFFFIVIVLGITGENTTREALVGLDMYLGNGIASLMLLFGILVIFTSLIAIGLTVKKILWYDLKIPEKWSFAIACVTPFLLYLIGVKDFIVVIGVIGGTMIAIDAILILLMYEKVKSRKVRLITYPLIIIFLIGIIYEIIYFIK